MGLLAVSCSKSYEEYMTMGVDLQDQGEYDKALDAFANAAGKAMDEAGSLAANEKAGDLLNYYIKDADSARHYYGLAIANAGAAESQALRDLIKKAMEVYASDAAVSGYEQWLERFAEDEAAHEVRYELAEVYHKNIRDLKRAITTYEYVVDNHPDTEQAPKALFSIGYIYANELAEQDNARTYYQKFLESYPDHEMVPSVVFELKYLGKALEDIPELKHLLSDPS